MRAAMLKALVYVAIAAAWATYTAVMVRGMQ